MNTDRDLLLQLHSDNIGRFDRIEAKIDANMALIQGWKTNADTTHNYLWLWLSLLTVFVGGGSIAMRVFGV